MEHRRKLDFNDKIEKTNEFFIEILPQDDSKRDNQFKPKIILFDLSCILHEFTSMQVEKLSNNLFTCFLYRASSLK